MDDLSRWAPGALRRRRTALCKRLAGQGPILRGSLIERYKRCGRPGCHCAEGRGHGPKYYLSVSYPKQRPRMHYVPGEYLEPVRERIENYHHLRELIEEICAINLELLRRRERL
jgi:hypothetical protein